MFDKIALVAELYYIYKLPQKKIAQQLGISRPWVSKLLKKAEESGMIKIEVNTVSAGVASLEEKIKTKFSLHDAKVANSQTGGESILRICCRTAAHYLISNVEDNDVIAFSWGQTLSTLADEFPQVAFPHVTMVPLLGGMGENNSILGNHIVSTLAEKTSSACQLIHLPAFINSPEEKEIFMKDPQTASTVNLAQNADILVCGIGSLDKSTVAQTGYISQKELDELRQQGAIGDISLNFINAQGQLVNHPIHNKLISKRFDEIKKNARISLAIALGSDKVDAIKASLLGNLVDVLVTDSDTANFLLED